MYLVTKLKLAKKKYKVNRVKASIDLSPDYSPYTTQAMQGLKQLSEKGEIYYLLLLL